MKLSLFLFVAKSFAQFNHTLCGREYVIENQNYEYHKLAKWGRGDEAMGTYNSMDLRPSQVNIFIFIKFG